MAKDILKEAIADAKAVREVALANAKAALEEAFTPKLQSMLSAKLTEELDEAEDMDEADEIDELDIKGPLGGGISFDEDKDEDVSEVELNAPLGLGSVSFDEDAEMEEDVTGMENEGMDENLDEEVNLEEILSELELEEGEEVSEDTVDEAKKDDEETVDEAKDKEEEMEEGFQSKPNATADDVQNVTYKADYIYEDNKEFDLDSLLEEINNLDEKKDDDEVNEGDFGEAKKDDMDEYGGFNVAPGQSGGTDDTYKAMKAAADGATDLSDFLNSIQEIPGAMKLLSNPRVFQNWASQIKFAQESVSVDEVQTELEETKKALKTVKSELNEVNLLNSKLLYVNRIFKANQLDEAQKLRVVETLDKAESAKEAKLIYETIKDTFNVAKSKKASKNKTKTRTIKEGLGMASKAAGTSTAPKKEVISESNDMVNRFQKLANIKINQ